MLKPINKVAQNPDVLVCASEQDVCELCDVRDNCIQCDSEWCNPFVKDWV